MSLTVTEPWEMFRNSLVGNPGGAAVKNLPASAGERCKRCEFDPWVRKIPWKEQLATHCSILTWRIPWTAKPGGLQSMGSQRDKTKIPIC